MPILDNVYSLWGDDLKSSLTSEAKLKIAAPSFSIYAYEALKKELEKIKSFEFIFTSPTFISEQLNDKKARERREFYIPKKQREHTLYGSEFEIQLKNKLTQRAIAKECAAWIRRKAIFKLNSSKLSLTKDTILFVPL